MKPLEIALDPLPDDEAEALSELEERRKVLSEMLFETAEKHIPGIEKAIQVVIRTAERIKTQGMRAEA